MISLNLDQLGSTLSILQHVKSLLPQDSNRIQNSSIKEPLTSNPNLSRFTHVNKDESNPNNIQIQIE